MFILNFFLIANISLQHNKQQHGAYRAFCWWKYSKIYHYPVSPQNTRFTRAAILKNGHNRYCIPIFFLLKSKIMFSILLGLKKIGPNKLWGGVVHVGWYWPTAYINHKLWQIFRGFSAINTYNLANELDVDLWAPWTHADKIRRHQKHTKQTQNYSNRTTGWCARAFSAKTRFWRPCWRPSWITQNPQL